MSRKRVFFFIIIVVLAATALAGYMLWNKPHKEVKDAGGLKVDAMELYNQYVSDSAKAKSLYTDKVLEVSGEISKISVNQLGEQVVLLKTPVNGAYINCTMEEKATALKEGDKVSIKAICSGYIAGDADMGLPGDVFLVRGYLSIK